VSLFTARVIAHLKAVCRLNVENWAGLPLARRQKPLFNAPHRSGYPTSSISCVLWILRYPGQRFRDDPLSSWTRPILADRTLAPAVKVDRLYQRMEQEFAAIEKRKAGKP